MPRVLDPFRFVLVAVAGWMNQRQLPAIDYLREENRVLREQIGEKRFRFNGRPAPKAGGKGAKGLGRKLLADVATIVYSRNSPGVASQAHRTEIRRQQEPWTRETS